MPTRCHEREIMLQESFYEHDLSNVPFRIQQLWKVCGSNMHRNSRIDASASMLWSRMDNRNQCLGTLRDSPLRDSQMKQKFDLNYSWMKCLRIQISHHISFPLG